ncbi:hemolysin family protein [Aquipuribacter sp. SD81]|uniref:hemolysin family protein n=1 Tax=Aquipuribacter sp. SD81 TaxID=3127703 RepID=UPI00301A80BA
MSDQTAVLVAVLLLAGNAFFVGAEFALISARRSRIEPLAEEGRRGARTTLRAMERVSLMMAGAQLGITACSLGLGALGEPAVAHLLEPVFEGLGVPEAFVHPIAFAIALAIVVYLHMVLGEMVPKNIAIAGPERSALVLGPMLYGVVTALKPVIVLLNGLANLLLRAVRVTPTDEVASAFTREQVATMIGESGREGLLDTEEVGLLEGALDLVDRTAGDIMVPRDQVRTLPTDARASDVHAATVETGFSRFPLVDASGEPVSYVHVKDVLPPKGERVNGRPVPAGSRHPLPDVQAAASVEQVVQALRAAGAHLGRVVRGEEVVGLVALEDALEELIGEVRDPAHRAGPRRRQGQGATT